MMLFVVVIITTDYIEIEFKLFTKIAVLARFAWW